MSILGLSRVDFDVSAAYPLSSPSRTYDATLRTLDRRVSSSESEPRIMRYGLTDFEWSAIRPFFPNKPRGVSSVTTDVFSTASSGYCGQALLRAIPR